MRNNDHQFMFAMNGPHNIGLQGSLGQAAPQQTLGDLSLQSAPPPEATDFLDKPYMEKTGLNLLIKAACPLTALIIQLKKIPAEFEVETLKQRLLIEIRNFEAQAKLDGVAAMTVLTARYLLCAVLDEAVLNTPAGVSGHWNNQSLLSIFHQDTWGGEKFFHILERMVEDPSANLDMLELLHFCLSLGFQGKYRVMERGQEHLNALRAHLFRIIQREKGDCEKPLSKHWKSTLQHLKKPKKLSFWRVTALTGIVMITIYASFNIALRSESTPVHQQLEKIVNTQLSA